MEERNLETDMLQWLQKEIQYHCNSNGEAEAYWDYRDREAMRENLPGYLKEYEGGDLAEFISDSMRDEDWYIDWIDGVEDDLMQAIKEDAEKLEDTDLKDYILTKMEDYTDFREIMESVGYNGVDDGIDKELKDIKFNVNITLATSDEANYDMSSIIVSFGTDYLQPEIDMLDAEHLDNSLTYLVHQQGYTLKELYDALLGNKEAGTFVNSVVNEINNNPAEATCGLTVLVEVNADEYSALISNEGNIEVSADTELGLYNSWIGGGSLFEIKLEKPFIFPASMILHADFDNITGSGAYSVGDCYGTMGDDRKGTIKQGGEVSVESEDLDAVADYVRATYGEQGEEVEESKSLNEDMFFMGDLRDSIDTENLIEPEKKKSRFVDVDNLPDEKKPMDFEDWVNSEECIATLIDCYDVDTEEELAECNISENDLVRIYNEVYLANYEADE